jgi:nucleoside-diphosphate-sugar epimerase
MRILITGNLGYLGPCVTRQLRQTWPGARFTGVDAGYFTGCAIEDISGPEGPDQQFLTDVRDLTPGLFNGVEAVVHLAALSNASLAKNFDAVTGDVNIRASLEIARRAKKAGVKSFIFASSCGVYGPSDENAGTEKSEVNPANGYLRSKIAAEDGLRTLAGRDFTITCIRFASACGLSPHFRFDAVLNHFVGSAIARGEIRVLSDGTPWQQLIHVRDMARAIDWAVVRPAANGGSFLVVNAGCDSWTWSARDLANAVAATLPGTVVSINREAPADRRSPKADFTLFRRLAPLHQPREKFVPVVLELKSALERHFAAHGTDFARLTRLRALSDLVEQGRLSADLTWPALPVTATHSGGQYATNAN